MYLNGCGHAGRGDTIQDDKGHQTDGERTSRHTLIESKLDGETDALLGAKVSERPGQH